MNNGEAISGTVIAVISMSSIIGLGIVVWYLLALNALFPRIGLKKNEGWIPVWNEAMILHRGGMSPWLMLLVLIPAGSLVVAVIRIIAISRIHHEYGKGAGMTVLAFFLPPVWATVLGSQLKNERGAATYDGSTAGTFAVPGQGAPSPFTPTGYGVQPQAPAAAGEFFAPAAPSAQPSSSAFSAADSQPWTAAPAVPLQLPPRQEPAPAAPQTPWGFGQETENAYQQLSTQEVQPLAKAFSDDGAVAPFTWPGGGADFSAPRPPAAPFPVPSNEWVPPVAPAAVAPVSNPDPEPVLETELTAPVASTDFDGGLDDDLDHTIFVQRGPTEYWALELVDGSVLELTSNDVIVGRRPTATGSSTTLTIIDSTRTLSKSHVRLHVIDGAWMVSDLNSTNGLAVIDAEGGEISVTPGTPEPATEEMMFGTMRVKLRLVSTDA